MYGFKNAQMTYTTLIQVSELRQLISSGAPYMVFDCTFDLSNPSVGETRYLESHIPGAIHADLDKNLSARHGSPGADGKMLVASDADKPASGGRHPLPNRERFTTWLSEVGFTNDMQAVVYDRNGANYCGRLWWMLKWVGHEAVAVLDGGLQAWETEGQALESGEATHHFQSNFELKPPLVRLVNADDVLLNIGNSDSGQTVIDARATPRYRGEVEPLDPVAGHIPGALNRPFSTNLDETGKFKSPEALRQEFDLLLSGRNAAGVVHQCGSGVSALPNLLAMEVAGLGKSALYAGSWSDWCSEPTRPVERN